MLERDFQKKFTTWLKDKGILYYKTTGGSMRGANGHFYISQAGFPDIIVFQHGEAVMIELKTDKGLLRPTQKELFPKLKKAGFEVYILRPKYWEDFKNEYEHQFNVLGRDKVSKALMFSCYVSGKEDKRTGSYAN